MLFWRFVHIGAINGATYINTDI